MLASGALLPGADRLGSRPSTRFFLTVPFGPTDAHRARRAHHRTHGRLHLVWPGGLWDWLDPVVPRRGDRARRARRGADVTAELWGARSPDPLVPPSRAATARCRARARRSESPTRSRSSTGCRTPSDARGSRRPTPRSRSTRAASRRATRSARASSTRSPRDSRSSRPTGEFVADEAAAARRRVHGAAERSRGARRSCCRRSAPIRRDSRAARTRAPAVAADWAYERTVEPLAAWCRAPRRARARARRCGSQRPAPRTLLGHAPRPRSARLELLDQGLVGRAQPRRRARSRPRSRAPRAPGRRRGSCAAARPRAAARARARSPSRRRAADRSSSVSTSVSIPVATLKTPRVPLATRMQRTTSSTCT